MWTPVLLLIVSFFVFLLGTYGPGDPVEVRLGHNYSPELAERLRERLGLNDHFFVQYARYVGRAVQGDLGKSLTFQNRDVITLIGPKLLTSAQLNIAGSIIAIGFGVPLGFYAATATGHVDRPYPGVLRADHFRTSGVLHRPVRHSHIRRQP